MLVLAAVVAHAGGVAVTLRAPNGGPVAGAVLVLESTAPAVAPHRRDKPTARIEQRDRRFVPLVVLGCNIHDDMIGYILVTDSPYFAQTDAHGLGRISGVPAGAYRLRVWAPRIADALPNLERLVQVGEAAETAVDFALTKALLAAPTPRPGRAEWDAY